MDSRKAKPHSHTAPSPQTRLHRTTTLVARQFRLKKDPLLESHVWRLNG